MQKLNMDGQFVSHVFKMHKNFIRIIALLTICILLSGVSNLLLSLRLSKVRRDLACTQLLVMKLTIVVTEAKTIDYPTNSIPCDLVNAK